MRKADISIHHPEQLEATVNDYHDGRRPEFVSCELETEAIKIKFYFDDLDEVEELIEQLGVGIAIIREKRIGAPEES